jgi:hypothetical protein
MTVDEALKILNENKANKYTKEEVQKILKVIQQLVKIDLAQLEERNKQEKYDA